MDEEKIELRARMKRSGGIRLTDQHGRELQLVDPRYTSLYEVAGHVLVEAPEVEFPYPWDQTDGARVNFRISIPLEIEA